MSRFFIFSPFHKSPSQNESAPVFEPVVDNLEIIEAERAEALSVLISLYKTWSNAWSETKNRLAPLNLTSENIERLNFFELEQSRSIVDFLAQILVAWEQGRTTELGQLFVSLAKEMRPALPYLESDDNTQPLTPNQLSTLRGFIDYVSYLLKTAINSLATLSARKIDFKDTCLSEGAARLLIKDRLGLTWFDYLDFKEEPTFGNGYYPELLQESVDFGL